jgi:hypothetical protein
MISLRSLSRRSGFRGRKLCPWLALGAGDDVGCWPIATNFL